MSQDREFAFGAHEFSTIAEIMRASTGVSMPPEKQELVYARLSKRLRALGLKDFAAYVALLQSPRGAEEMQNLVNRLTTNLTRFYREPHHFADMAGLVSRAIAEGRQRFRVWSAACSTGQEAYSIADALIEAGALKLADVKVLATDIDTEVLSKAEAGRYPLSELDDAPASLKKRFPVEGGEARAAPELRRLISFRQLNLIGEWPMKGPFDAIFCRNVFIYFEADTQASVARRMTSLLSPGGRLYIGHAESLRQPQDLRLTGVTTYERRAA